MGTRCHQAVPRDTVSLLLLVSILPLAGPSEPHPPLGGAKRPEQVRKLPREGLVSMSFSTLPPGRCSP